MLLSSFKKLYLQVFCEIIPMRQSVCEYFFTVIVIAVVDGLVHKTIVTISVSMSKVRIIWRFVARKKSFS